MLFLNICVIDCLDCSNTYCMSFGRFLDGLVWFMVFNATLNNISVISWGSVVLVEETGIPRENHRPVASYWQTFITSNTPRHERGLNSQHCWWYALIAQVVVNPTTIRSRPRWPLRFLVRLWMSIVYYEKNIWKAIVINSANINKTNNHLSS